MGFSPVTEARLQELRKKHRPVVLEVVEERSKKGRAWKDSKGLASKLYSFKHDSRPSVKDTQTSKGSGDVPAEPDGPNLEHSSDLEKFLGSLDVDTEVDSLPDLQEQVSSLILVRAPSLAIKILFARLVLFPHLTYPWCTLIEMLMSANDWLIVLEINIHQ